MNPCLRWRGMSIPFRQGLFISLISLIQILWTIQVSAQTLDTDPLAVTSVCQGSQIDVTGIRTSAASDFAVQLSKDGTTYTDVPSVFLTASGRFEITYRATIPASTLPGSTYRIRLVAKNPDINGTPSPTILTVKAKPVAPTVDAVTLDCQRRNNNDLYTYIYMGVTAGASASLYNSNLSLNGTGVFNTNTPSNAYFQLSKPFSASDNGYQYPINETTYFISQTINGCESDRVQTIVRTLYRPASGPTPVNLFNAFYGRLAYCQGDKSYPLNVNGHSAPPENFQVSYSLQNASLQTVSTTTVPPIPDTSVPGSQTYKLSLVPIDPTKGCPNVVDPNGPYLVVDVNARPGKPTVPTTSMTLCQSQSTIPLSATTTTANASLVWYGTNATGGTGTSTPTQLSTATIGIVKYYVAQKLGDCESERTEIVVEVRPTPSAPTVQSVSICQNSVAPVLQATGQNLLWYTTNSGGTGSATTPVVNTSQTSQTTYYVSQSLNGCESSRATFSVTVSAQPAAPVVSQKNICQFAPSETASATGTGLTWYSTDGTKLASAPLINTDKGTSFSVLVTQTVNSCESPKATLVVNVLVTPSPTVSKTAVELCQGVAAQPLEATGTALKWTDPNGTVTTTAPAPPTQTATTKAGGDIYYVSQTLNGCESPKVAISVVVQSIPTMSVLGTTTTNLGLDVPLKLTFTGVGPFRYKLSGGLTGTATKDTTILVLPTQTTVYQIVEVTNKCGTGGIGTSASATITVLIPTIQTLPLPSTTLCAGASLTTNFSTTGTFNSGSVFKIQLAKVDVDTTKISFVDAQGSLATNGQVIATIPSTIAAGSYWVRVIATNPKIPINGKVSTTVLTVRPLAGATLTGNQTIYEGQPASLSVVFSGDGPWTFAYRDSSATGLGTIVSVSTNANPHPFEVKPKKTTSYFLTSLSNGCGNGSITARVVTVTVNPLLGIEDQSLADAVDVYPIPSTASLTVRIRGLSSTQTALLEITDLAGRTTSRQETRQSTSSFILDQHPAGTYLLHIQVGGRKATKRIMKL